jgi:hypothetical protein
MPVTRRGFNRARDIGTESSNGSFAILFMASRIRIEFDPSTVLLSIVSGDKYGHGEYQYHAQPPKWRRLGSGEDHDSGPLCRAAVTRPKNKPEPATPTTYNQTTQSGHPKRPAHGLSYYREWSLRPRQQPDDKNPAQDSSLLRDVSSVRWY